MKRFTVILLIQVVVIFAAAFLGSWAYAKWRQTTATPSPSHVHAADELSWLRSELGLNPAQADKLEKLHEEFLFEQARLCERHCSARFELAELIKKNTEMSPKMKELSAAMSEAEAESERLTMEHILAVGKELTEEQRAKFVAKVYQQMCSGCPMKLHAPGLGKQSSCNSDTLRCCQACAPETGA